jgi:hypothetical protein
VDVKITQLKQLQSTISSLFAQRDGDQAKQIASLVKTYSSMKPKDAARIFDSLPDDVLLPVAQQMKPDILALLLPDMSADNAKTLTVKLANKLSLPQTTDALAPPVQLPAPAAPQTAALSNAPAPQANPDPVRSKPRKTRPSSQSSADGASTPSSPSPAPQAPATSATPAAATPAQNQAPPKT